MPTHRVTMYFVPTILKRNKNKAGKKKYDG